MKSLSNSMYDETHALKNKMIEFLSGQDKYNASIRAKLAKSETPDDGILSLGNIVHLDLNNDDDKNINNPNTPTTPSSSLQNPMGNKKSTNKSFFLSRNSWIINPDHILRRSWDLSILLPCLVYTAIRVPISFGFNSNEFDIENELEWFIVNRLIDLVFISDMILIFLTALRDGKNYNTNKLDISIAYLSSWFIIDLFATLPLDLLVWSGSGDNNFESSTTRSSKLLRVAKIFRVFRMLRLVRVQRIVTTMEITSGLNISMFSIIKFIVVFLLLGHLLACSLLAVGTEEYSSDSNNHTGWLTTTVHSDTQTDQYIAALHWAIQTMTTIGYGDIELETDGERLLGLFAMIIGGVCFAYGITRVVHIVSLMDKSQTNLVNEITTINEWATYYDFPSKLINEVKSYYRYKHSIQYFDEQKLMCQLSQPIRREVMQYMYGSFFKRVKFFNGLNDNNFMMELILRIETELAPPFSLIVSENCFSDSLYVIRRGHCGVFMGQQTKDIKNVLMLGVSNSFGDFAMLEKPAKLHASVVALEWCDLAKITRKTYMELIKYFPQHKAWMEQNIKNRMKDFLKQMNDRERDQNNESSLLSTETYTEYDDDENNNNNNNEVSMSSINKHHSRKQQQSKVMSVFMETQINQVESQINDWIQSVEDIQIAAHQ